MVAAKSKQVDQPPRPPPSQPLFAHAATRLAVAQICRSTGFRRSQSPALDALTRISTFYLQELARSASAHAGLAGRTQCNLFDVVCALEDLAAPSGFTGASRVNSKLLSSSTLRDIRRFVNVSEEMPLAKPMPAQRDDHGSGVWSRNFGVADDCRNRSEIPSWLPEIPDLGSGLESVDNHGRDELYWEEKRVEEGNCAERLGPEKVDERRKRLPWKRERVKFSVGLGMEKRRRMEKLKVVLDSNGVDEMERRLNGKS